MGRFYFGFKTFMFGIRDSFVSPESVLREVGIGPGECVLDYGCGPGSYALAAAELVGESGKVYALDISPLAVARVEKLAAKKSIANVSTICSACATGLARGGVDVALLYDVLHHLGDAKSVLRELHRVLGPKGRLSVSDHYMREADIVEKVTAGGGFTLTNKGKRSYTFSRAEWHTRPGASGSDQPRALKRPAGVS
jgi:ubiquinone/menaquinone biosynthesis C-methylase UbiE